jgi:hypothetical protein
MELGRQLEALCSEAKGTVVLVAPFAKAPIIDRLFAQINPRVAIRCVTRWRPDEILSGVSDIEIWESIRARKGAELWLHPSLHAKYYRVDDSCLVGSANLTATALGYTPRPNLELLLSVPNNHPDLVGFEQQIFKNAVRVTDEFYEYVQATISGLKSDFIKEKIIAFDLRPEPQNLIAPLVGAEAWLPTLRNPKDLYVVYSGRVYELTTASQYAALLDLQELDIPPGFSKKAFESCAAMVLLQKPMIQKIDAFIAQPRRFGSVKEFLSKQACADIEDFDPSIAWQTLMRWLLYFFKDRYKVEQTNYSEVFSKTYP